MRNVVIFRFEYSHGISFTLIGSQEEISIFLDEDTRDIDDAPLIIETEDGTRLHPQEQFYADLSATRTYLENPEVNQPPSNMIPDHSPLPNDLKPILPFLPDELKEELYHIKPAEDVPSVLSFVPTERLDEWRNTQIAKKFRSSSSVVRDMLLQNPSLLTNLGIEAPAISPYPRVRVYAKTKTSAKSQERSIHLSNSQPLAIHFQVSGQSQKVCARSSDITPTETHRWIIQGGEGIELDVKVTKGKASLKLMDAPDEVIVETPNSKVFAVSAPTTQLDITKKSLTTCKYELTSACFATDSI